MDNRAYVPGGDEMSKQRFWASRDRNSDTIYLWVGDKPKAKDGRWQLLGFAVGRCVCRLRVKDFRGLFGCNIRRGRCATFVSADKE